MCKKCILILPYFGKLKNYFQLFLNSVENNFGIDLLIITDQDLSNYSLPQNVLKIKMNFITFCEYTQKLFDFKISLNTPYKLCDFKPAYGVIVSQFFDISNYDYWGHCDSDLIFGNFYIIRNILSTMRYKKIFANGHLTIYRNEMQNNLRFTHRLDNVLVYKMAFQNPIIYGFDEGGNNFEGKLLSVHEIFMNECPAEVYVDDLCFNASVDYYLLHNSTYIEAKKKWINSKKQNFLVYDNHELRCGSKKYIYCHLQKRKMKIRFCNENKFYIVANYFTSSKMLCIALQYFNLNSILFEIEKTIRRLKRYIVKKQKKPID